MLEKLTVRTFKSLEDVTVDLGRVNVFIGANGSGKSNLLEALGILAAAADGKVDDQSLLSRGVRPGVPALYKSAFPARAGERIPPHLFFEARGKHARYSVSLHNPLSEPAPAWRFKTELWEDEQTGEKLVGRSPNSSNPEGAHRERGLAALKAVEVRSGPALELLKLLQGYVIYSPTTSVLRGVAPETQPKHPVGLSGGELPRAVSDLLRQRKEDAPIRRICKETLGLMNWAKGFGATASSRMSLSPSAASSRSVLRFRDRFMRDGITLCRGMTFPRAPCMLCFLP